MESQQNEASSSKELVNSEMLLSSKDNSLNCIENHLQSLGFVISNGEAKFKLDEATINTGANTDFSIIDAEDPASFVVLGRGSMESIQASCLASYMDIQQKSVSVDYNSMISSLDSNDVHQKLTELLQENGRLKEALKQNNSAMKQQIGTLASWQEEMMKVHQNHKKKFAETTDLIKYLKKENCELKMKLSMDQFDNSEAGFNIIEANTCGERQGIKSTIVERAQKKMASFEDSVITSELKCKELLNDVEKLTILSDFLNMEIRGTASIDENLHVTQNDLNINQPQIQNMIENIARLRELKDFFQGAKDRCYKITKSLDDAIKTLDDKVEKYEINVGIKSYMQKLSENSERQQQRPMAVNLQNKLTDFLGEYESTLCDFTIPLQEDVSVASGTSETVNMTGKSRTDEKGLLEQEKLRLAKERESLEQEKKMISEQKESLEKEQKILINARKFLEQKMVTLNEEKTSLDQQSQLYESFEKTLQADKKTLEVTCHDLAKKVDLTMNLLAKKEEESKAYQARVKQQEEAIYSLEVQMRVYEEDFTQERKVKDSLLLDHNKVVADLVTQMEFNKHLQSQISCLKDGQSLQPGIQSPELLSIACPKCQSIFRDAINLEQHVESCLNLD